VTRPTESNVPTARYSCHDLSLQTSQADKSNYYQYHDSDIMTVILEWAECKTFVSSYQFFLIEDFVFHYSIDLKIFASKEASNTYNALVSFKSA
jgi:hypothetical protein